MVEREREGDRKNELGWTKILNQFFALLRYCAMFGVGGDQRRRYNDRHGKATGKWHETFHWAHIFRRKWIKHGNVISRQNCWFSFK